MKDILLRIYYLILKIKECNVIVFNKFISLIIKPPIVRTTDETLTKIVQDKCSISRYGDGEFSLMRGKSLLFQTHCNELSQRLWEIIKIQHDRHLVCIPNTFQNLDWFAKRPEIYWTKYLNLNRSKIYKMIDRKMEYYDALVTRLYIDYKDKSKAGQRFYKLKKLWDKQDILLVEGEQSRLGMGNDLFKNANSIKRIICPPINAFAKYNEILSEVRKQAISKIVLISLGPTATVLSFDLFKIGYQAIDIGHIDIEYEWYLQNAEVKCPVKNKYIGEVPNGTVVEDIVDMKYQTEIIAKIV